MLSSLNRSAAYPFSLNNRFDLRMFLGISTCPAKMLKSFCFWVTGKDRRKASFMKQLEERSGSRVVVATTAMLSFISFWHAAAIVLNDLASSAYYVGGIAEHAIGKSAPWFILGVMLFSIATGKCYGVLFDLFATASASVWTHASVSVVPLFA
jgi:hypothetical protein